jgi:hypothetical protein
VFRASRLSRGNRIFPTQVLITPSSVVQFTPQWIGRQEESIHMAHIASVKIITGLLLSNVLIETSGGASPIKCHGHRKRDAVRMKALIEGHQNEYYRSGGQSAAPCAGPCRSCLAVGPRTSADNRMPRWTMLSARRYAAATVKPASRRTRMRGSAHWCSRPSRRNPRYLNSRLTGFDVDSLMPFGRFGWTSKTASASWPISGARDAAAPPQYIAERPDNEVERSVDLSSSGGRRSAPRTSRHRSSVSAK